MRAGGEQLENSKHILPGIETLRVKWWGDPSRSPIAVPGPFPLPILSLTCCPHTYKGREPERKTDAPACPILSFLLLGADRHRPVKLFDDFFARFSAFALGMAEAAAADTVLNIEYEIVARPRTNPHRNCVETK